MARNTVLTLILSTACVLILQYLLTPRPAMAGVIIDPIGAVGDGIADDTVPLQNAINAAQAGTVTGGAVVRLTKGMYRITAPLTIQHGLAGLQSATRSIVIEGGGATIRLDTAVSGPGATALKIQPIQTLGSGYGLGHFVIRDLILEVANQAANTAIGVDIGEPGKACDNFSWSRLENVSIVYLGRAQDPGLQAHQLQ